MITKPVQTKLDKLVGAIKQYKYILNATYEFISDYNIEIKIKTSCTSQFPKYNVNEISMMIEDYERYLIKYYNENFKMEWVD